MAKFELKLPKMGESVAEATITSWLKDIGDTIEADEAVLEIATKKSISLLAVVRYFCFCKCVSCLFISSLVS